METKLKEQLHENRRIPKILRFRKSERMVHWAIAVPFMVCYATALILVIFYNPDPLRPYRFIFSWIHRISGICLITLPMVSIIKSRGDLRIYWNNIKQAWIWTMEDIKWLFLIGLAAVSSKITLPEQGKFNAAEKINFMTLMSTYPFYILTGLFIWFTNGALLSWLVHFGMALIATPLLTGHIFMATLNPGTRAGLSGMITGFVDRQWARHHYTRWYREHFESDAETAESYIQATRQQIYSYKPQNTDFGYAMEAAVTVQPVPDMTDNLLHRTKTAQENVTSNLSGPHPHLSSSPSYPEQR